MTVRHLLHAAARRLLDAQCDDTLDEARLEVELLYGEAAGLDRARVLAAGNDEPPPEVSARFEALLARRLSHEPLAYILGRRECYGLTFEVAPGVLIPRPDTETLIEAALDAVRANPHARRLVNVVDVGTGSGVIALAVARHAPTAKVYAVDASTEALAIAGRNRRRLGLTDRVVLLAGDLLEALPVPADIVVANLPYIPTADVDRLAPEVRDWEPRAALDGGPDGLDVIRALVEELPAHLAGEAAVLLEVGHDQAPEVARLLEAALGAPARLRHDLAGIARVVEVRVGYD
ncbi:MAG: peptide chain release factor N(5)-glutamine methyltransferase [Dehalococcoidia bacterium]